MNVPFKSGMIGGFDAQLAHEFFQGFANHALVTLHIDNLRGENAHHQCETVFKAFARALRMAVAIDPRLGGVDAVDQRVALRSVGAPMSKRTVAVVDYGMGNLRSVVAGGRRTSPAGIDIGRGVRGRRHLASRRSSPPPSASSCRARARCPTACASCATPACRRRCSTPPRPSRSMGVCIGMQMLLERSEEGADRRERRGWADRRRGGALSARGPPAARRQPLQSAADGLEPGLPGPAACPLGGHSRCAAYFYFVHSFLRASVG